MYQNTAQSSAHQVYIQAIPMAEAWILEENIIRVALHQSSIVQDAVEHYTYTNI